MLALDGVEVPVLKCVLRDLERLTGIVVKRYDYWPLSNVFYVRRFTRMQSCPVTAYSTPQFVSARDLDDEVGPPLGDGI